MFYLIVPRTINTKAILFASTNEVFAMFTLNCLESLRKCLLSTFEPCGTSTMLQLDQVLEALLSTSTKVLDPSLLSGFSPNGLIHAGR